MTAAHTDPHDKPEQDEPALNRRQLLGFSIAGPVLSLGVGLSAPSDSEAAMLQVPGDLTDICDYGDLVFKVAFLTLPLIRLTVEPNGRAKLELPRLESGQGISTACAMMVAEDLDLPMAQVDVVSSDARPELLFNQQTGGSTTMRVMSFALPQLAAQARALDASRRPKLGRAPLCIEHATRRGDRTWWSVRKLWQPEPGGSMDCAHFGLGHQTAFAIPGDGQTHATH